MLIATSTPFLRTLRLFLSPPCLWQNVVELLDDCFQVAAAADEPVDMNFVKKHAVAMSAQVGRRIQIDDIHLSASNS